MKPVATAAGSNPATVDRAEDDDEITGARAGLDIGVEKTGDDPGGGREVAFKAARSDDAWRAAIFR